MLVGCNVGSIVGLGVGPPVGATVITQVKNLLAQKVTGELEKNNGSTSLIASPQCFLDLQRFFQTPSSVVDKTSPQNVNECFASMRRNSGMVRFLQKILLLPPPQTQQTSSAR